MFKSFFSLLGQVVKLFSKQESLTEVESTETLSDELKQESSEHKSAQAKEGVLEQAGVELEVDDVNVLSGDWGSAVPQRASALFPETLPSMRKSERSETQGKLLYGAEGLAELNDRETPSPDSLFAEAQADLEPQPPPEKPERPFPKSEAPILIPSIPTAPKPTHYNAQVQVGRLMRPDAEPPPPMVDPTRPPEVLHSGKRGRRRMIQSREEGTLGFDEGSDLKGGRTFQRNLNSPPRGGSVGIEHPAYHDPRGERGASSRAQYMVGTGQFGVTPESDPIPSGPLNRGADVMIRQTSIHELSPPPLKPKPVRFAKGNYLRFWGNYSAQPSYLHFGSLVRSERFIQLLPVWYNELDDLEDEAREEWAHLDDESPLEGEADWRRLLNPTMSSPIDFLLHRDRAEQLSLLTRI